MALSGFTRSPLSIDSRRSPRRAFNRAIGILKNGDYEMAQAIQISEGGLSFVVPTIYRPGERVVVTLVFPGASCLVLRGSVVNERARVGRMYSYGIEFLTLELHQRRVIRSYVSAKTEAEADVERSEDADD